MRELLLLAWYELAMLAVLVAVGSGPACWPRGLSPTTRLALAPALGLGLASCALMTAGQFISMRLAAFVVLLPLMAASLWLARRELRARATARIGAPDALRLAAVVAGVGALLNLPLVIRESLGPIGYRVSDAVGYVGLALGLEEHRMGGSRWMADWDLTNQFTWAYSGQIQHIAENMFPAAMNGLMGWNGSTTQSATMIVYVIVGALGAFAVTRVIVGVRNLDVLAGLLFAGPVFYTLFINGSEATLCGQAMLLPFGLFAWRVLKGGDRRDVVMLGLLTASLHTLYGSVVPPVVIAGVLVLAVAAFVAWRSGRLTRPLVVHAAKTVGMVLGLAIVLSPVSFIRDVRLWHSIASGNDWIPAIPYDLPIEVIPAWIIGTREFYLLPYDIDGNFRDLIQGGLLPLGLIALAVLALWRNRRLLVFAALIPAVALISLYAAETRGCAYCVERNMMAMAPVVVLLLAGAVGVLWQFRSRLLKAAAVVVAAGIAVALLHQTSISVRRGVTASMLTPEARAAVDATADYKGTLLLEALDATEEAPTEMGALYHSLRATTDARLALNAEHNGYGGTVYLPVVKGTRRSQSWSSDYGLVFTHTPGIASDREPVERFGAYALERRTAPFDAVVVGGVLVDRAKRDTTGVAYLFPQFSGPLEFWIAATRPDRVWLRFTLAGPGTDTVPLPPSAVVESQAPDRVDLCVAVPGTGDKRVVKLTLDWTSLTPNPASSSFEVSSDPKPGPALTRTAVSTRPCPQPAAERDE